MALQVLFFVVRIGALDRRNFRRGGQVVDHRVEHQRHAFVLERGAEHCRHDLVSDGALAQAGLDLFDAQLFAIEVQLH
ncbi:hypothetical protein D3C76_1500320 [compost metagenome]